LASKRAPGADGAGYVERFVQLEPAPGRSESTEQPARIAEFLDGQGVGPYLNAVAFYYPLIGNFRERVRAIVDFSRASSPREFWRRAARERWPKQTTIRILSSTPVRSRRPRMRPPRAPKEPPSRMSQRSTKIGRRERDGARDGAAAVMLATRLVTHPARSPVRR